MAAMAAKDFHFEMGDLPKRYLAKLAVYMKEGPRSPEASAFSKPKRELPKKAIAPPSGFLIKASLRHGSMESKAFTSQVAVLAMLSLYLGRRRHLSPAAASDVIAELDVNPVICRGAEITAVDGLIIKADATSP